MHLRVLAPILTHIPKRPTRFDLFCRIQLT
jgi:hypothetical protein